VQLNIREHPHLDYGYAVTSYSSQGTTADRVLIHVDTEQAHEKLINTRLAYVSVSRARYDAQIYTNDAATLGEGLGKKVSKRSALEAERSISRGRDDGQESRASAILQRDQVQREASQEQRSGVIYKTP
jgi:ATP-dependent exoDNAse (exonuclease V) alpha subunit